MFGIVHLSLEVVSVAGLGFTGNNQITEGSWIFHK